MPRITDFGDVHAQLAGGVVVEEEQRLGALDHDVVGAHGDEVDADRVVAAGVDREPQLGADAVRAGHEHRALVAGGNLHQRAEAADAGQHLGALRAPHERLDAIDQRVAGVDVDAGVAVSHAWAIAHAVPGRRGRLEGGGMISYRRLPLHRAVSPRHHV